MGNINSIYVLVLLIILVGGYIQPVIARPDASLWTRELHESLVDADKLRVRSGGTCHRQVEQEKTLLEIDDDETISALIKQIRLNDADSGFHCMCCGHPTLEFYRDGLPVVSLGFHHGQSFRWMDHDQWTGDALLTEESASYLIHWLADHGVEDPLNEVLATQTREDEMTAKLERATRGMSSALKKSISSGEFSENLKTEYESENEQVGILLFMLGTSNGSWSSYDWIDQIPNDLLRTYDSEVLQTAIRESLIGGDRQRRRGAARFWEAWRSPLVDWNPTDKENLCSIVLTVQQESAYYPLRQQALGNIRSWENTLSKEEIDRRLWAGLRDPHESVRRKAILTVGRIDYQEAIPHLMEVLEGRPVAYVSLPHIPPDELVYVPAGFDHVAGERSEPEVAALALGYLKYTPATKAIEMMSDSPMRDVALALLGEMDKLKPEHFMLGEPNRELQLAAVEAVVRSRGRVGLKWAIDYRQATHWWEPEYVLKRLREMLVENNAPDIERVRNSSSLKELGEWYNQNGESYLTQ